MGRTGVCWDNAMAESFWATLKVEYFYRHAFATRAQVHDGVGQWIEQFYNRTRIHTALGGYSPVEYELHQQSTWAKAATGLLHPPSRAVTKARSAAVVTAASLSKKGSRQL